VDVEESVMRTPMLNPDDLARAVSLESLRLPASPRVAEIHVEETEDSTGDDALEVYVVLADDVTDEASTWEHVAPIEAAIREAIRDAGESRFPYFTFGKRSQYELRYSPDLDAEA
jgi:hypothetical protein